MRIHRAVHVDFHTMPNITDFGARYNAGEFAARLLASRVQYINLVASCNLGFCYYPTDVGVRYPYMQGDRFGETLRACRERGIGVSAYVNVGLNHENAYLHPDWCRVNEKGERLYGDKTGNFFRMMCYNSDGFRQYLLGIVREIATRYEVDGYFFDGLRIQPCYCEKCRADRKRLGIAENKKNAWEFAHQSLLALCKEIKPMLGQKKVFFCGLPFADGLSEHYEVECLPSGAWGYDYFHQAAAFARSFDDNPVYMTGRFQADWGDFGGIKSKASFEYDLYDALSNACSICFGDHLHPAENLIECLYCRIAQVYGECKSYENYALGAKYIAEVGVLNDGDIFALSENRFVGVARMLSELKYTYNLITEDSDFSAYKLILLPDSHLLTQKTAKKLSRYIRCGGKVLSTGFSALNGRKTGFAMPEYNFVEFCGLDKENYPYFTFMQGEDKTTKWAEYRSAILMKNKSGEALASYIEPYNKRYYDGRHGYFYTPPKQENGYASAVVAESVAHISFAVFSAYAEHFLSEHRTLVGQILQKLIKNPLIKETNLPVTARVTLTEKDEYRLLHIRTDYPEIKNGKGVIEEHNLLKRGRQVCVEGEYGEIFDVKTGKKIKSRYKNGYTVIKLPEIQGYLMLCLPKNK